MRPHLLAIAAVALTAVATLGCPAGHDSSAPQPATVASPTADAAAAPAESRTAPAATTLERLEAGDRACYVVVRDAAGAELSHPGDFELCPGGGADASALVGSRVTLETRRESIQAESCQGNPECTDSETVDLVVAVRPAA
jgi:hypothetical protein